MPIVKHIGFGKFAVQDGERRLSVHASKAEAEAALVLFADRPMLGLNADTGELTVPAGALQPAAAPDALAPPVKPLDSREYERNLDRLFTERRDALAKKVKAVIQEDLAAEYGPERAADYAERMMRDIEPILADPRREARRRERRVHGLDTAA